jgi:D-alanyl-D-alanine carboxypeptidase
MQLSRVTALVLVMFGASIAFVPVRARALQLGDPNVVASIDSLVTLARAGGKVPGISVEVVRGSKVIVARGYGFADIENDVPANAATVYRIGSITKQFTAAAIMQLVEAHKFSLDDDITKVLPGYPTQGHGVTIRHLLTHTSGIRSFTSMGKRFTDVMRMDVTPTQLVDFFKSEPFDFEPGDKFSYNNSGYALLGVIIEKVSGEPYEQYLQKHIFGPLSLGATSYCSERRIIRHRAAGYTLMGDKVVNAEPMSMTYPFSAGGLCSTVSDLAVWQRALASGRVVSTYSYSEMTTPGTLSNGDQISYGFGLFLGTLAGHRKIAHGGSINGFITELAYFPDDSLSVVVLTNSDANQPALLAAKIARRVLGLPQGD